MWGTATVRGEEDVIVRRLDQDDEYCWKTDRAVLGHVLHTDKQVRGFVANDWSWLERRAHRNPEGDEFWSWESDYKEPYYVAAAGLLWDSWAFGLSWDRQYGNEFTEDWWSLQFSFGPLHFSIQRTWNLP